MPLHTAQEVQLKSLDEFPDLPEAAKRPATTTGIWHSLYDKDAKIADMWFLRELSFDEYYRKVCRRPQHGSSQAPNHGRADTALGLSQPSIPDTALKVHCAQPSSINMSCSAGLRTCYAV